ncbi:MAG: hypothetical protein IJG51_06905 [Synergistaceae bacterium]|nr:hypothetical protein [Synergistaceae bacterium]MBQ3398598.1 hypothetical protein [Synergistaceae bacterium]MBQ6419258.1 hypothetical protein [Synergistaceae bacterium]MBQ6664537.1 hypothetical protein [Synergistaceae bacterium]MBR0247803.1 hypothetical protein [Synergistaceae bacterium]
MKKRDGASLLNVMVFMLFAVMITAQVFFFAKWSADSVAEEREIMMYRLNLDSLVEEGKSALKVTGTKAIVHSTKLDDTNGELTFSSFYEGAKAEYSNGNDWEPSTVYGDTYNITIHDLEYSFDARVFDRTNFINNYSGSNMHKKVFAAMLPLGIIVSNDSGDISRDKVGKPIYNPVYNRFFLIRAWVQLPENYYGRKLMYQVLVSRDEPNHNDVQVLSFQEVWF